MKTSIISATTEPDARGRRLLSSCRPLGSGGAICIAAHSLAISVACGCAGGEQPKDGFEWTAGEDGIGGAADGGGGEGDTGIGESPPDLGGAPGTPPTPVPTSLVQLGGTGLLDGTRWRWNPGLGLPGDTGWLEGDGLQLALSLSTASAGSVSVRGHVQADSTALMEGTHTLGVRLYSDPSTAPGTLVKSAQLQVEIEAGMFVTSLSDALAWDIVLGGARWARWSLDGDNLGATTEIGAVPFAGVAGLVDADDVRPGDEPIPAEGFAGLPVRIFRDWYAPGDAIETGLSDAWDCHHSARVPGSVRQSYLTERPRPYCQLNTDYVSAPGRDLRFFEYTPVISDAHPDVDCDPSDDRCADRIFVGRTFRYNEYGCVGLPALSLSSEYFVPYLYGFDDALTPLDLVEVEVVSVCVRA